jgi:hypothetical protein
MVSKHAELSRRLAWSTHDEEWDKYQNKLACKASCETCRLTNQISVLKIDVFEWPLPADLTVSKAIVFEISVPKAVVVWRDVTTDLFLDAFRDGEDVHSEEKLWYATNHSCLPSFSSKLSKIQLASATKPVEGTHYRRIHITMATVGNLCVRHPWFRYDYYERNYLAPSTEVFQKNSVPKCSAQCSFAEHQLDHMYLDPWTRSTGHTSNQVIAAQSTCPPAMSLDEFRTFGHLRSDLLLQWANILLQLRMPSLDWSKESTYYLILQACLEAGPSSNDGSVHRETHTDLLNDEFVSGMVAALTDGLGRLRENWQNDIAVSLFTCLATRVLSLTTSRPLIDSLLGFLSEARSVTLKWARQLLERKASCESEGDRKNLNQQVLMAALTCTSTFDIESDLLQPLLHSVGNLGALVEAAIIAQDHLPTTGSVSNHPILLMLSHRWRRVMHRSQEFVKDEVVAQNNPGFHEAIQRFWADYLPSATQWAALSSSKGHILDARMVQGNAAPTNITFNLLEGLLLVNGYPLARLPREYESKKAYSQLFGSQVLEVMPSTRPGMRFSACREQQGWIVHFALIGPELVIQAVRRGDATSVEENSDPEVCEFIPSWNLEGDVPISFIRNYSHWLNVSTGNIEFRPVDKPWMPSPGNWVLTRNNGRNILSRDGCYLIDPHSSTGTTLSAFLKPIESTFNLDIVFHQANHALVLDLPRFSLSFTLAEGESAIRSKHYSGMCIDECQGIGTLVGLENKLVLRQEGVSKSCTPLRIVLVPRGPLSPRVVSNHVSVNINHSDSLRV